MEVYYTLAGVLLLVIVGVHSDNPNAQQKPNKVAGPGLWNSIGEGLKTPGKAMPTLIHLPHDIENPGMTNKQIIKSYKGNLYMCHLMYLLRKKYLMIKSAVILLFLLILKFS